MINKIHTALLEFQSLANVLSTSSIDSILGKLSPLAGVIVGWNVIGGDNNGEERDGVFKNVDLLGAGDDECAIVFNDDLRLGVKSVPGISDSLSIIDKLKPGSGDILFIFNETFSLFEIDGGEDGFKILFGVDNGVNDLKLLSGVLILLINGVTFLFLILWLTLIGVSSIHVDKLNARYIDAFCVYVSTDLIISLVLGDDGDIPIL